MKQETQSENGNDGQEEENDGIGEIIETDPDNIMNNDPCRVKIVYSIVDLDTHGNGAIYFS